jgi:outer membrane protein assembly factor BamB
MRTSAILFQVATTGFLSVGAAIASNGSVWSSSGATIRPAYRLAWTARLSANADSAPVVAAGVTLPSGEKTDVAVVLAGNNRYDCSPGKPVSRAVTYAFDAATGRRLWQQATTGPARCTTAAPAIAGGYVYAPGLDGFVHKYSVVSGQETLGTGWPERFTRMPAVEKESANLVVAGHWLYATTSGFIGDAGHYEGHLVAIDLTSGQQTVWNSLCSRIHVLLSARRRDPAYCPYTQSGMFGRGQAAIDRVNGDVYVATGNGPWNGRTSWGDSVLKLSPNGRRLVDAFTPSNQEFLRVHDLDLGSSGPAILPTVQAVGSVYHLLVQGGKGGARSRRGPAVLWLVNRDRMGSAAGPGSLGGQLQTIRAPGGCGVFAAPAVRTDAQGGVWVFYATNCGLSGYRLITGGSRAPHLVATWRVSTYHFTTPVVDGSNLVLARPHAVDILQASTGRRIWSTDQNGSGGSIGDIHWEYPAVSGTLLLMTDESRGLYAYRESSG